MNCDLCHELIEPGELRSAPILVSGYVTRRREGGVNALALRREHADHRAHPNCLWLARKGVHFDQQSLAL